MSLTTDQLIALAPLFVLGTSVTVVLAFIAWQRRHLATATLTVLGLNLTLLSLVGVLQITPVQVTPLLSIDNFTVLYTALIVIAALACTTLARGYLEGMSGRKEEFYVLLLCATAGGVVLAASRHLASLFIGLELLSIPLFGMAAYTFQQRISLEAGIKYLVMSAAASTFMLFGMALIYAVSGSLVYADLAVASQGGLHAGWLTIGMVMMLVAFGFKLSLVPFHLWTPDVYEGAPSPVSTFLATVSKIAVFAMLARLLYLAPAGNNEQLQIVLTVIALASMLGGNLLALRQNNIKRMLGYSAIAHLGYALTAVVAINSGVVETGDNIAIEAAGMYLATYLLTTIGAFGVVTLVSSPYRGYDAALLHNYRGLFWHRPYLAALFTVMMLSLAGVPATVGFIGKLYAFAAGVQSELWWLVGGIVIGTGISLFYYLRIMIILYVAPPLQIRRDAASNWGQRAGGIMVLIVAAAVLFLGIYPPPLIELVKAATIAGG